MDNKNSILLIDPTFDPSFAPSCKLLVKVGLYSFSYAIINAENNKVNAVFDEQECENGAKKLAERLKTDRYLTLPYQDVKIAAHTFNAITIPLALFSEENLSINTPYFPENLSTNLYVDEQHHFGFNTIFSLKKSIDEILNFTNGKRLHENSGLLNQAEQLNGPSLILDFTVGHVNAIYLNNNKIIFQQGYEVDQVEEFNYYLLLMMNQLNIDKSSIIYICGIIHENDENYLCLCKYFDTVEFLTVSNGLNQEILDDMPGHYYSSLLALDKCV